MYPTNRNIIGHDNINSLKDLINKSLLPELKKQIENKEYFENTLLEQVSALKSEIAEWKSFTLEQLEKRVIHSSRNKRPPGHTEYHNAMVEKINNIQGEIDFLGNSPLGEEMQELKRYLSERLHVHQKSLSEKQEPAEIMPPTERQLEKYRDDRLNTSRMSLSRTQNNLEDIQQGLVVLKYRLKLMEDYGK